MQIRHMNGRALAAPLLITAAVMAMAADGKAAAAWRDLGELCFGTPQTMAMATVGSGAADAASAASATPSTSTRILSCEPLPDAPGKSLTTMLVSFPPLARSAPHRHPGSVQAVVLEGTVRSQMEGGPVQDYAAGTGWFEAPRALHVLAENPDPTHAATLLATFVTDTGCTRLVIPEPQPA